MSSASETLKIETLEPYTKERCYRHKRRASEAGLQTLVTCGARTAEEQWAEYRKGRVQLPSGAWEVTGKTVTNATPKDAPHCRRAAYDLWLLWPKRGGTGLVLATMDAADGWTNADIAAQLKAFRELVVLGKELGLVAGAEWIHRLDWPHFERPDWRSLPVP